MFFVDVVVFGATGISILFNYSIGGLVLWIALAWLVASLLPFWRET